MTKAIADAAPVNESVAIETVTKTELLPAGSLSMQPAWLGTGNATETALELPADLNIAQWKEIGRKLARAHKITQWWIGDWANHGEKIYGSKYAEVRKVLDEEGAGEYSDQTLRLYASVARRVPPLNRFNNLPWSFHAVVAGISQEDQSRWLAAAVENKWTRQQFKMAIKTDKADPKLVACFHNPGFDWVGWVTQGQRWLNREIKDLKGWSTQRLILVLKEFKNLNTIEAELRAELDQRC